MRGAHRPKQIIGRLTEGQYALLKKRVEAERHMTIQKLIAAAVNAYLREDFVVHPDGSYTVGTEALIYEGEDDEALDLDEFEVDPLESDEVEWWGTKDLAAYAERVTGRNVNMKMLYDLIKERAPQEIPRGARYAWRTNDPDLKLLVEYIRDGELERIRDRRAAEFGGLQWEYTPKLPPQHRVTRRK